MKELKGFTLIELLAYVFIATVLVGASLKVYTIYKNNLASTHVMEVVIGIAESIEFFSEDRIKNNVNTKLIPTSKKFPVEINYDEGSKQGKDADGNVYSFARVDTNVHTSFFPNLLNAYSAYAIEVNLVESEVCYSFLQKIHPHFKWIATSQGVVKDGGSAIQGDSNVFIDSRCTDGVTVYLLNP